jgi:hypothetical protein
LIFKVLSVAAITTGVFALGIPFVSHELPYKMWFPYDYKKNQLHFWLSVAYQGFDTICFSVVDITHDVLIAMFMCYIIGMLEELCGRLENMKVGELSLNQKKTNQKRFDSKAKSKIRDIGESSKASDAETENKREFLKCLMFHSKVTRISRKVEELFSTMIMVQGLMTTLVVCTTMYALTIVS